MAQDEKKVKKAQKAREKARAKRYKKINNGLDLCLIVSCFLVCLAAAVVKGIREKAA